MKLTKNTKFSTPSSPKLLFPNPSKWSPVPWKETTSANKTKSSLPLTTATTDSLRELWTKQWKYTTAFQKQSVTTKKLNQQVKFLITLCSLPIGFTVAIMKLKWSKCILHKTINLTVECSCFVESRTSSETIKIGVFPKLTSLTKEFKSLKSSLMNRLLDSIFDFLNMFLLHF